MIEKTKLHYNKTCKYGGFLSILSVVPSIQLH